MDVSFGADSSLSSRSLHSDRAEDLCDALWLLPKEASLMGRGESCTCLGSFTFLIVIAVLD